MCENRLTNTFVDNFKGLFGPSSRIWRAAETRGCVVKCGISRIEFRINLTTKNYIYWIIDYPTFITWFENI